MANLLQKNVLWAIIIAWCYYGSVFAIDKNDCNMVAGQVDLTKIADASRSFLFNLQGEGTNYLDVLPLDALSRALINLKRYCCIKEQFANPSECALYKNETTKNFPESLFLYDHLLDVSFRRLDAYTDPGLRYDIDPDPTGQERRAFITQAGEAKNGETAKTIMDKYNTYRKAKYILPKSTSAENIWNIVDDVGLIDNRNNTSKVSLTDKYNNICKIVQKIYTSRGNPATTIGQNAHDKCIALATKRINEEYMYTKVLMLKKSNELLHETFSAYTQKYFVEEKLTTLSSLMQKMKSLFATLVQQAAPSKSCSL